MSLKRSLSDLVSALFVAAVPSSASWRETSPQVWPGPLLSRVPQSCIHPRKGTSWSSESVMHVTALALRAFACMDL